MNPISPNPGSSSVESPPPDKGASKVGWGSCVATITMGILLFEAISGLAIRFLPFHSAIQWSVIVHTILGVIATVPVVWYMVRHWIDYRNYAMSHIVLLGVTGFGSLAVCGVSGFIVTWQGVFGVKTSAFWREVHFFSTYLVLLTVLPHVVFSFLRVWREGRNGALGSYIFQSFGISIAGILLIGGLHGVYSGRKHVNEFPSDYSFLYGTNRPFAPSLAMTDTGGAFAEESLAGSKTCGTSGCHSQIMEEWTPSAHRYAAMDPAFQGIQDVMAKQNGPESTRYCGGCHDPISLFSGTKNIFVENLTGLHGYQEGISCLACHAVRETDVKGNANYTMTQPSEYLWQWNDSGIARIARDFLIRTYPEEHNKLSKRAFKKPEYCAACHKQFIDQEINKVGWVQLQNQYDNWAASHWNHKGDASKTIECRECHMPLVDSTDPASGDEADYNRTANDAKHRSHRFLGANQMIPRMLNLEGGETHARLVEEWLQGKIDIPEIGDKWSKGPIVKLGLEVPDEVGVGDPIPMRVVLGSNKVGHDFPTGPLDIIQSWLEVRVTDDNGREVYSSGKRDAKNFIEPGTFLFKAEPVDQQGNLIDRHNLWEMVGVRYRRALFPGYSDAVKYTIPCPSTVVRSDEKRADDTREESVEVPGVSDSGEYHITVILQYRKIDQYLLDYLLGEGKVTAPVTEITRASTTVKVRQSKTNAAIPAVPPAQTLVRAEP
ncbi:MAG: MFS transporter [Verrucomicrobia bacterium]|nr:MFS transporter [Verrucomicrobiota bacterium]